MKKVMLSYAIIVALGVKLKIHEKPVLHLH